MTRRSVVLIVLAEFTLTATGPTTPALADGTDVSPSKGDLVVELTKSTSTWSPSAVGSDQGAVAVHVPPPACTDSGGASFGSTALADCTPSTVCQPIAGSPTGGVVVVYTGGWDAEQFSTSGNFCTPGESSPQQALPSLILRAFQRIPLPEPALDIQPPKGKTLIGLETIYSTKAEPFTRNLRLLGQSIQLRIHATSYDWIHGDGTAQSTDWPGKPWQRGTTIDSYITHVYEDTGDVAPSVRVTWSAEYRVGNGAWQRVNGTVERTSPPAALQILEAEPQLVDP
jgi:hypothetical protein